MGERQLDKLEVTGSSPVAPMVASMLLAAKAGPDGGSRCKLVERPACRIPVTWSIRGGRMSKQLEGNEDWVAREKGRIRTKGAKAAERASAGLGTLDDDAALREYDLPPRPVRIKPVPRISEPNKR